MDIGPRAVPSPETQTSDAATQQTSILPNSPAATTPASALSALSPIPAPAASSSASAALPADPGTTTQGTLPDATGSAAPVHQVSAALLSLSRGADGAQTMTLRLQPPELGQVQIRIDRPQEAPAQVDIAVERPETMTLLLRDQPELQRALDQAGVPPDGRSLTLHLATPDAPAPSAAAHGGMAANAGSGQGGGNGSGTRTSGNGSAEESADTAPDDAPIPLPRWLRAGLDITA
ncbi:MAG TPA: flagellar hook-length control protein FliK [Acetobacteraceae bacterium]|nr:flagellar hook-length control protein FliK [Acetobacteraceae bacterium]